MASSSSRRLSFSTGSPISCRHRGSPGIACHLETSQEYSRPITSSGGPSWRWQSGTSASGARLRPAGMGATVTPPEAAAKRIKHPVRTTPHAKAWAKLMARVGEGFSLACLTCGGDIRLIAFRLPSECETIPGLRTLGNLRLLRTSCPRTRADPEDSAPPWRTARTASAFSRTWPAYRLGRTRADARRPRRLSNVTCRSLAPQ